jgi:hypothetical protein
VEQCDRAAAQLFQAAVDALEQIVGLVLSISRSVSRMTRNRCAPFDLRAGKQLVNVRADDVLEEHERQAARDGTSSPEAE